MEDIGIALPGGQHRLVRGGLFREELGVEVLIRLLCRKLARDHPGDHILGDGEEIVGGDADVHMVLFHHRADVLHVFGQVEADVLAVAQQILSIGDNAVLRLFGEHDVQHFHGFFAARGVLLQIPVQCNLEIGGGHDPLFAVLAEEGQKGRVDALLLKHLHAGGAAKVHGHFPVPEQVHHVIVSQPKVVRREAGILNELGHPLECPRPDSVVQTHPLAVGAVAVGGAPLAPLRSGKLGSRKPLQRLHAGVVVGIIGGKAADAYLLEGLTGRHKAVVIGRQRDVVLFEQAAVDHESVGVGAHRQPVHAAVLIFEAVEVGVVDRARLVGGSKIHQAVLQGSCIVQREAAAGDDVRQAAVLLQEFVKVQIVVAHDELDIHVRQLRLDIGGIDLVQAIRPQIHLNGLSVFLHLRPFCRLSAASGQQGYPQHQCHKQGKKAAQCFLLHQTIHLMTRRQPAVSRQAASVFLSVPSRLTERTPQSLFVCILFYAPNTTTPLERHVHSKMTI